MVNLYKGYLEKKLKEAGVTGKIYKSMKELKQFSSIELAAVIPSDEEFKREGSRAYVIKEGKRYLRTKVYKRTTKFLVVISNKNDSITDETMCKFVALLERGIDDGNGNWVEIECEQGEWVDEADSIIRNNIAVQLLLTFTGGVYVDKATTPVSNVEIGDMTISK